MKTLLTVVALIASMSTALADTWTYREDVDKMTSKASRFASLQSDNSLNLAPPYSGMNYGGLMVRKHPQHGLDVMFYISKGQILCTPYEGCSVKVRFGDKPPVTFYASPSGSHNSTTIFFNNAQGFIDQASKVKTIKVQANIYQAGPQILEFESADPLVWLQKPKTK